MFKSQLFARFWHRKNVINKIFMFSSAIVRSVFDLNCIRKSWVFLGWILWLFLISLNLMLVKPHHFQTTSFATSYRENRITLTKFSEITFIVSFLFVFPIYDILYNLYEFIGLLVFPFISGNTLAL